MDDSRSGGKLSGPLALKFQQQPPEFPFQHVFFEVKIYLQDMDTGEPKCGADLPLDVRLWYDETPRTEAPKDCIEVEGGQQELFIRKETGCCDVRVRITKCSMDLENRSFSICATAIDADKHIGAHVIESFSTSFKVMRHRLLIDDTKPWDETWYKDEGGREKCIEISVKLVDYESKLVTNRRMPLRVTLLYADSLIQVTNQDILKVFGTTSDHLATNSGGEVAVENGVADVKLRIEDVSKNHQGQNFRIKIAPDTLNSPTDCDVSHGLSRAVTVRSKRNKRRNNHATAGTSGTRLPPDLGPPRQHLSPNIDSTGANLHSAHVPRSMQSANDRRLLPADGSSESCRVVLHAAIEWINQALEDLRHMEWQRVGYEPLVDGSADTTRPLHVISNPNDRIAALNHAYERNVAPFIDALAGVDDEHASKRTRIADSPPSMTQTMHVGESAGAASKVIKDGLQQRRANGIQATRPKFANGRSHEDDDEEEEDTAGGNRLISSLERPVLSRTRTSVNAVLEAIHDSKQGSAPPAFPPRVQTSVFDDEKKSSSSLPPPVNAGATAGAVSGATTVNSTLGPPAMMRGVSSLYVGDSLPATPANGDSRSTGNVAQADSSLELTDIDLAEQSVRVVLAKRFKPPTSGAALGFPAFDAEHRLVGLYREIQADNSTQIVFVPADDPDAGLTRSDYEFAAKAFEREVANKSDCVHELARFGSLDRLKENVAIYHWSKEAFANDIDGRSDIQQSGSNHQRQSNIVSTTASSSAANDPVALMGYDTSSVTLFATVVPNGFRAFPCNDASFIQYQARRYARTQYVALLA